MNLKLGESQSKVYELTAKLEENLVFAAPFAHIAMCVDDVAVDCHQRAASVKTVEMRRVMRESRR